MQKHREIPWPRILAEGGAIVVSILFAFWIDAWWSDRQDAGELRESLRAVETELELALDSLRITGDRFELKAKAGLRLLQLTGPKVGPDVVVEVVDLIGTVMRGSTPRVSTGSLRILTTSGELARVENRELQQALVSWPEQLDHLYQMEDAVLQSWLGEVRPQIVTHIPYVNLDMEVGFRDYPDMREEFTQAVGRPSEFDSDFMGLLGSLQFENGIHTVTTLSMIAAHRADLRIREGEEILAQIRAELGRR